MNYLKFYQKFFVIDIIMVEGAPNVKRTHENHNVYLYMTWEIPSVDSKKEFAHNNS